MHNDRNNGNWSELKGKRLNKFEDEPLHNLKVKPSHPREEMELQKEKKHTKFLGRKL